MKKIILILLVLFFMLPQRVQAVESERPASRPAGPAGAVVTLLEGKAQLFASEQAPGRQLASGDQVFRNNEIRVGEKSRVELRLPDGSFLRLAQKTRITIGQLELDDATTRKNYRFNLVAGKLWAKVRKLLTADSVFEIHTKTAIAGVRGTAFAMDFKGDSSGQIRVYEGEVSAGPKTPGAAAERMLVKAGQEVKVSSRGVPSKPKPFDPKTDTSDWSRWNQARDRLVEPAPEPAPPAGGAVPPPAAAAAAGVAPAAGALVPAAVLAAGASGAASAVSGAAGDAGLKPDAAGKAAPQPAGAANTAPKGTGYLSFNVRWPALQPKGRKSKTPVMGSCVAAGISVVDAVAYGPSSERLTSGGNWKCADDIHLLLDVPAGSNIRLVITGKNENGEVLYRVEHTGIAVEEGQTTSVETMDAETFAAPVHMTPQPKAVFADGNVVFKWAEVPGASSYHLQVSTSPDFDSPIIDTKTASASNKTGVALTSGVYYWRVKGIDNFNNEGQWSPSASMTLDADAPVNKTPEKFINGGEARTKLPVVNLALSAAKSNGITGYFITESAAMPAVGDPGWVAIPPTPLFEAVVPYALSLGNGKKTVYTWFKDAIGHVSRAKSSAIVLDSDLSRTTITGHPVNPTNSTSARFGFTSTLQNAKFLCALDGVSSACTSTKSYEGLAEGKHIFTVTAKDAAGNSDPIPASYKWSIDTTPPHTRISSRPDNPSLETSVTFVFTSTKDESLFQCKLDDGDFTACVVPQFYKNLPGGRHTFTVRAKDAVGNIDPTPASYTWTILTEHLGTAITNRPEDPSHSTEASFGFTAARSGVSFKCSIDDGPFSSCVSPMPYAGLTEDKHTFIVKAIDGHGAEDAVPARYDWTIMVPPINKTLPGFINKGGTRFTDKAALKLSIAASSKKGIAAYLATESPARPGEEDPQWVDIAETPEFNKTVEYTAKLRTGPVTLYVWFKDSSGYMSESRRDTIYLINTNYVVMLFMLLQTTVMIML